jgi:cyanate lyase
VPVTGPGLKVLIEEEFGDGIMWRSDFDMDIVRKSDPKGDRIAPGMTGKFLPFKDEGAKGSKMGYRVKKK